MPHWQTLVALGIVALTLGIFLFRIIRPAQNKGSCGSNCGCERPKVGPPDPKGHA